MTPGMTRAPHQLWAPQAWLGQGWVQNVLLQVGANGCWASVQAGVNRPVNTSDVQCLPGPVLPGLVNAHSHAFQRAFVGLAERRDAAQDDFWAWRDRMYGVALRITPEQLRAVACHLYRELLQGGYTHTCEFHYLHHAPDGTAYADEASMCRALAQAAVDTGMGLNPLKDMVMRESDRPTLHCGGVVKDLRPPACLHGSAPREVLAVHG